MNNPFYLSLVSVPSSVYKVGSGSSIPKMPYRKLTSTKRCMAIICFLLGRMVISDDMEEIHIFIANAMSLVLLKIC